MKPGREKSLLPYGSPFFSNSSAFRLSADVCKKCLHWKLATGQEKLDEDAAANVNMLTLTLAPEFPITHAHMLR